MSAPTEYVLVFQFDATTSEEFNELVASEPDLAQHLPALSVVDGHDFGCGEFNFFVFTLAPEIDMSSGITFLQSRYPDRSLRVGCRATYEDEYAPMWPEGLLHFAVA